MGPTNGNCVKLGWPIVCIQLEDSDRCTDGFEDGRMNNAFNTADGPTDHSEDFRLNTPLKPLTLQTRWSYRKGTNHRLLYHFNPSMERGRDYPKAILRIAPLTCCALLAQAREYLTSKGCFDQRHTVLQSRGARLRNDVSLSEYSIIYSWNWNCISLASRSGSLESSIAMSLAGP
ncbi:hypothetical protein GALMADRAFT_148614 [Galerina marginata CBS 339.88]|uniref:Uncharacterized protein n=1 Tax=Galerina marginata (strain CBS 339.88) TaxID=685588 RepID=A0A067S3Z6_GALM3|nr:hypothetical protein GALMADRAFT_148614 [Galerina marginata CBS 339.88]